MIGVIGVSGARGVSGLGSRAVGAFALASLLLLGACATRPTFDATLPADAPVWSGRLSLNVQSEPPQSLSAAFDLKGSSEVGELVLATPLGSTLARMNWAPGRATLTSPQETREFASVDELVMQVTGTPLPVPALFDWLGGRATEVDGWQADLSQHAAGRFSARRSAPPPVADLRLVFERQ